MASILSRVVLGAGIATALMLGGPAIAEAQARPGAPAPSDAAKQAARKLVDEGIAAQDAKDYDQAIERYKQAYALVPHPILMFNIGQAHRLAGRPDQAVPFYERYLALDPSGSESAAARAALAAILAAASAGDASKGISGQTTRPGEQGEPGETAPAEVRPGEPTQPGEDGSPPSVGQGAPPPTTTPPMPALEPGAPHQVDTMASPGRTLRLTGLALGGAGLASTVVGFYFTTRVLKLEQDADGATGAQFDEIARQGNAAERNGDIAYLVGGALVIGGAVTYWLGHQKDRAAQTTAWTPVVGAGFTGIALSGSLP